MSIALLNPFILVAPIVKTRVYYDAGFTAAATSITTTQTSHKSISTTEAANDEYAFFYQAILNHDGTASDVISLLFESPTQRQAYNLESQDATDQHNVGGAYAYLGGTNRTITLDSDEETAATNEIQDYALCALKLVTNDAFQHSAGQTDSVTSTYATKASVTVGAGTWIIIASASCLQSAAGVSKVRVFDGTTAYGEESGTFFAQDTTNWTPYWFVRRITTTATTTFSLQNARVAATGTASIREATIIALDTSEFENVYYAEQLTDQTTTTTTAFGGTGLTNTFTIANPSNKHLLLASAYVGSSATNRSTQSRLFNVTSSTSYSGTHLREANATAERYPGFACQIVTFSGASQTIEWKHNIAGGAGTSTIGEMSIVILDLGTAV